MKRFILFLVLFATLGASNSFAQKKVLVVDYFESDESYSAYVNEIRNQVISGIQATSRLSIIDAYTEQSLINEDQDRLQVIQGLGASFIMIGNVDNISIEEKTSENGKSTYSAELTVTLKFINVGDGSLYASKSITTYGGGSLLGVGSTEQKAVDGAVTAIQGKMERIVDEYFALKGTIVEINEVKKDKLISCYIDLGSGHGITKGQYVKVLQIKDIAGRRSAIEIGRLRVETTVAEDLSDCKTMKGQVEILAAINSGAEIIVETIKARGLLGGLDALTE